MVNCSGSAVALPWEAQNLPAILQAWYPGESGGQAVADVLFGKVNPSGHLPITFYRATADLPAFTDYSMANRTYRYFGGKPLYAFGHGLSYTKFDFEGGSLDSRKIAADGTVKVRFTVKNSGNVDGDEVAQVYFRHINSAVPQPKLALCGSTRVQLKAGESSDVAVEVPAERLRYWDTERKQYVVEAGEYELLVGAASDAIRYAGISGPGAGAVGGAEQRGESAALPAMQCAGRRVSGGEAAGGAQVADGRRGCDGDE